MDRLVSCWHSTAEVRVLSHGRPCVICGRRVALGPVFLQGRGFSLTSIIPPLLPTQFIRHWSHILLGIYTIVK